jgi:ribonuclease T2
MTGSTRNKGSAALAVAVIGALLAWYSQRQAEKSSPIEPPAARPTEADATATGPPTVRAVAPFDFYLLALSIHPAFCADGNQGKTECRARADHALTLHGLWPENLRSGAYPHDCPAPRLDLAPGLASDLAEVMPGMASRLHEHEWRKHGGCSGLGGDDYFRRALDLTRALGAALEPGLTTRAGGETDGARLRAVANRSRAGLGATFTLHCRGLRGTQRGAPYLMEVRQCIDNDGPNGAPGSLLDCASVDRRDQGCGRSFRIAAP